MKKIIRIIMISSFAFILTACSGKNSAVTETSFSEVNSENVSTSSELTSETAADDTEAVRDVFAMDTYMTVKAYGPQGDAAVEAAVEEINRLDALLSTGNEDSEVAGINANNGGHLSEDGAVLMERSLELYKSTGGVFDVAIYPVMKAWGFTDGNYRVPDDETLKSLLQLADPSLIEYDSSTADVNFEEKGVQIDFGGIAKGYTSSRIMDIYKEKGVTSGLVNLGGNAQVLGTKPDGSLWRVAVQSPDAEDEYLGVLETKDKAIITSGGYERYFVDEATGVKYHHIIDPKTGYSANNGLISVTIVSADSTLADGLSTSLFVLGTEDAIAYCEEHCAEDGFDAIMEDEDGKLYITDGIMDDFINMNNTANIQEIKTK